MQESEGRALFGVFKKLTSACFSVIARETIQLLVNDMPRNRLTRLTRRIRLCKTRNLLTKSSLLRLILVQIHTKASAIGCIFVFCIMLRTCSEDGSRFALF